MTMMAKKAKADCLLVINSLDPESLGGSGFFCDGLSLVLPGGASTRSSGTMGVLWNEQRKEGLEGITI